MRYAEIFSNGLNFLRLQTEVFHSLHFISFLSDAISNVERHFAVVGVLEEMEKSLAVMERFLPR